MRTILTFLALLALSVNVWAQYCKDTQFQACTHTLAAKTGLAGQENQIFKDYTVMYNQFLSLFGTPVGQTLGIQQVCNALEVFNGCMYNNSYCITMQRLSQNTDIQNAWFIDGTINMYRFNCGPGANTLIHTGLSCAQRVITNYINTLETCVTTYQSSITHDRINACNHQNKLINCWSQPFALSPCRETQAADSWWACEANRVFAYDQFPNCGITCDVHFGPPGAAAFQQMHHKVLDGEHWFKIPDYMDMVDGKVRLVEGQWMNN